MRVLFPTSRQNLEPMEAFETSPCCLRNSRYRHLSYIGKIFGPFCCQVGQTPLNYAAKAYCAGACARGISTTLLRFAFIVFFISPDFRPVGQSPPVILSIHSPTVETGAPPSGLANVIQNRASTPAAPLRAHWQIQVEALGVEPRSDVVTLRLQAVTGQR